MPPVATGQQFANAVHLNWKRFGTELLSDDPTSSRQAHWLILSRGAKLAVSPAP